MIVDTLQRSKIYRLGSAWDIVCDFIKSLTARSEQKRYELQGDDIYAMVMSYETRARDTAILESHRTYVDVQCVLQGSESIEWFPSETLTVDSPYDASIDAALYKTDSPGLSRITMGPGVFAVFFPADAHMPGLADDDGPSNIVKVVVKIRTDLLLGDGR